MSSFIKLDMKDKRILRELFANGRISYSEIAKKVELSKETVNYRVNNMVKKGFLIGFNSVYDVKKIGWQTYLLYLRLKNLDNEKEKEIIEILKAHPNIAWIIKCIGNYDLIMKFFVKGNLEFNTILKELETKIPNFDEYITDNVDFEIPVPVAYLYSPLKPEPDSIRTEERFEADDLDFKILNKIANNSRMQISEIAAELKIPRDTIKYHLTKLEKNKVILTYRPSAWSGSKSLGYSWYFVLLRFRSLSQSKKSSLLSFLSSNMFVSYIYELIGRNDLGFEIRLKTGDELNDVLMEIRKLLSNDFKSQELSLILKEFKYTYFPDCLKIIPK